MESFSLVHNGAGEAESADVPAGESNGEVLSKAERRGSQEGNEPGAQVNTSGIQTTLGISGVRLKRAVASSPCEQTSCTEWLRECSCAAEAIS